jgi:hypothetical protein
MYVGWVIFVYLDNSKRVIHIPSKVRIAPKMGIKKYTGTFIEPVKGVTDDAHRKVMAIFIDANQFLYGVVDLLKSKCTKVDDNNYIFESRGEFWQYVDGLAKQIIHEKLVEPILMFSKLKHITTCLDGIAAAGKIFQQFLRRKTSTYITDKSGKLLLTDSMILPGSQMVRTFAINLQHIFTEVFAPRGVSLLFSLDDISGEGEHKMLDYYRHSNWSNEGLPSLVWSNDSDVPVCMLSTRYENLYVRTNVVKFVKNAPGAPVVQSSAGDAEASASPSSPNGGGQLVAEDKIYLLGDLRSLMCSDHIDRLNCQFFINFFGNDFLPEMLNTIDLKESYNAFKKASVPKDGGEKILLTTSEGFFNPIAFIKFLNNFDEFSFYFDIGIPSVGPRGFPREMHQFSSVYPAKPVIDDPNSNETKLMKLGFKRFYLDNVMNAERLAFPQETDVPSVSTDRKRYDFEKKMAFSYLKVYIWYFYYANGFYLQLPDGSTFEPYYEYNFPPLFNSLKKLLSDPTLKPNEPNGSPIECIQDLLNLRPQRRTPEYYSMLPRWVKPGTNVYEPLPQMFAVLQRKDALLLPNAEHVLEVRREVEELYPIDPLKSLFIKTRISKRVNLTLEEIEQAPLGRFGKPKMTFTFVNEGTKVYPRFDVSAVMRSIARYIGVEQSREPVLPTIVGTIEHIQLTDFRNSNFAVGDDIDL